MPKKGNIDCGSSPISLLPRLRCLYNLVLVLVFMPGAKPIRSSTNIRYVSALDIEGRTTYSSCRCCYRSLFSDPQKERWRRKEGGVIVVIEVVVIVVVIVVR